MQQQFRSRETYKGVGTCQRHATQTGHLQSREGRKREGRAQVAHAYSHLPMACNPNRPPAVKGGKEAGGASSSRT